MGFQVRSLNSDSLEEIEWVARGMRATLLEVVGRDLFDMDWLRNRVRQHLPEGGVFVLEGPGGLGGHTIVRQEEGWGLFSTTYVDPAWRRQGLARRLLERGEQWMREQGLSRARTFTHPANRPLQVLFEQRGYQLEPVDSDFVVLWRNL